MDHWWQKDISGCGLSGIINWDGKRISGAAIRKSIALQHDRGNGQGGGFAAYGIYPEAQGPLRPAHNVYRGAWQAHQGF